MIFAALIYSAFLIAKPEQPVLFSIANQDKNQTIIRWYWEDEFTPDEKEKVRTWLSSVENGVESTIGSFPFDLHFHIHRRTNSSEPVPWANTRRYTFSQGVDFHIDPDFSLNAFMNDWTAPHEISHLSLPYLGRSNAWFAEGYASFMQYQVMEKMGIYSSAEVKAKYKSKLDRAKPYYRGNSDFVTIAKDLQRRHLYPEMYWGSAGFFLRLDQSLRDEYGTSLPELIKVYQTCCRLKDSSISEVITSWDRILGGSVCSELLKSYGTESADEVFEKSSNPSTFVPLLL